MPDDEFLQLATLKMDKGKTFEPHLNLDKELIPFELKLKQNTWDIINTSMWQAVNYSEGTGWRAKINNNKVWGKTGTSQNPHGEPHSWFAGYTKINNGELESQIREGKTELDKIAKDILEFSNKQSKLDDII